MFCLFLKKSHYLGALIARLNTDFLQGASKGVEKIAESHKAVTLEVVNVENPEGEELVRQCAVLERLSRHWLGVPFHSVQRLERKIRGD